MQSAILRLALAQLTVIGYSILVVGVLLKIRFDSAAPFIFATALRDYGCFLFVLPAAWLIWAGVSSNSPRANTGDGGSIFLCGVVVLVILILLAIAGTVSVATYYPPHVSTPA